MPLGTNGLLYIGNCEWLPSAEPEIHRPPNDLPTLVEPFIGRSDKIDAFQTAYYIGKAYRGGYIIDNRVRDHSPFQGVGSCDLVVALPPDFSKHLPSNTTSMKTATIGAEVSGRVDASGFHSGGGTVTAERSVSYYAPETRYAYFASKKPDGPRFTIVASTLQPRVIRSVIKASGNGHEVTFNGAVAPAALVTALTMPTVDMLASHDAQPISGTPWWTCTDTITRELVGG